MGEGIRRRKRHCPICGATYTYTNFMSRRGPIVRIVEGEVGTIVHVNDTHLHTCYRRLIEETQQPEANT